MSKKVDSYLLSRNFARAAQTFGTIKAGEEELYHPLLSSIESNLLRVYRTHPTRLNNHDMLDALHLCSLQINGYIHGITYDFGKYLNANTAPLLNALLMAIDPYTRPEIYAAAEQLYDLDTSDGKSNYFEIPVKCLLRIGKSVEFWTANRDRHGYFTMLEEYIGALVQGEEMDFAVIMKS